MIHRKKISTTPQRFGEVVAGRRRFLKIDNLTFSAPRRLRKHPLAANQIVALHFLDYNTPDEEGVGGGDGGGGGGVAYITSDPANALIEGGVRASPFIVMEGVGNCPLTQMLFFTPPLKDPDLLLVERPPYCPVSAPPHKD